MQFTFHADPGHAWLSVPRKMLFDLGIAEKITPYSYEKDNTVYLEEDCDASTFFHAAKAKGIELEFAERHINCQSAIRRYERFCLKPNE